jgi:putative ABC transport system permease protein
VSVQDFYAALLAAAVIAAVGCGALAYLRSNLGLAMCATGDNPDMIRALGVNVGWMTTLGLAISNGLVAFSGALLAQYQGFADVQMGIGMVVWGFASVIIGESLVGSRQVGWMIVGAVMGSILFRLLVAIALRWGLNPNDLKLITALFVFAALILPGAIAAVQSHLSPRSAIQTESN